MTLHRVAFDMRVTLVAEITAGSKRWAIRKAYEAAKDAFQQSGNKALAQEGLTYIYASPLKAVAIEANQPNESTAHD